jgi:hypothetical protein
MKAGKILHASTQTGSLIDGEQAMVISAHLENIKILRTNSLTSRKSPSQKAEKIF